MVKRVQIREQRSLSAGPISLLLNGTHEFSELVLSRMASCLWFRAAQFSRVGRPKCGNLESCGGKSRYSPWKLRYKLARTSSFQRPEWANGKRSIYESQSLQKFRCLASIPLECSHAPPPVCRGRVCCHRWLRDTSRVCEVWP